MIKLKFSLTVIMLIALLTSSAQQTDYKIYRDSLSKLSCKPTDSLTVAETVERLQKTDTTQFNKNLHLYFRDLGWAYYRNYMHTKDATDLKNAVDAYLHQVDVHKDYWNLCFCYFLLKDCDKGNFYLQKYLENTPEEYRQSEEKINRMTSKCN